MTIIDDTAPTRKEPSLVLQTALLVGLTVAAIGIGWGSGVYLTSQLPAAKVQEQSELNKATEAHLAESHEAMGVVYLEPMTTNLAGPNSAWVRLELALVFDGKNDLLIAQMIQQDILAYLRTVKIHQIEGASGFQHLKSDMEERASIRSDGAVKSILIRTLLFE